VVGTYKIIIIIYNIRSRRWRKDDDDERDIICTRKEYNVLYYCVYRKARRIIIVYAYNSTRYWGIIYIYIYGYIWLVCVCICVRGPRLTHRTEAFDPTRIIHSQSSSSSSSSWLGIYYTQRVKYIIIIRTWQIRFAHRTVKLRVYYTPFSRIVCPKRRKKIINNNNNKSRKDTFFFLVSTHIFSGEITYYYYIEYFHGAQQLPMYVPTYIYILDIAYFQCHDYFIIIVCNCASGYITICTSCKSLEFDRLYISQWSLGFCLSSKTNS